MPFLRLHALRKRRCRVARDSQFISVDDPRWEDALRHIPHDLYHKPEYLRIVAASHENPQKTGAFYWRDGDQYALIPLLFNALPPWVKEGSSGKIGNYWCDAASPYGYAGPITNRPGQSEGAILAALRDAAEQEGVLALFLRAHPLLESSFHPVTEDSSSVIGTTYTIELPDISKDHNVGESLLMSYRSSVRRAVRGLLTDTTIQFTINDWDQLKSFSSLYRENMERLSAASSYFFEDNYFFELSSALPDSVFLLSAMNGDQLIGGVILFGCGSLLQYHLAAHHHIWRDRGLPKIIVHRAAEWGACEGYRQFHLGGGLGGADDSLAHFKKGFHPVSSPYRVYRMVIDDQIYEDTVAAIPDPVADYFPSYRSPQRRIVSSEADIELASAS
jgi:hypothetical protein